MEGTAAAAGEPTMGLRNRVVGEAAPGQAVGETNALLKALYLERMQRTSQIKSFQFGPSQAVEVVINETAGLAMGSHVWAASKHLGDYIINTFSHKDLHQRKILELGAGCGLTSMALKKHFGSDTKIVITERAALLPQIRKNLELNHLQEDENLVVQELNWGENLSAITETYDFIVAAEVVFSEQLFQPLIDTIIALSGFNTVLLLAHTERHHTEGTFFKTLGDYYQSTKLHRIPRLPSRSASAPASPGGSNIVSFSAIPRITSSTYLAPQMLQKNIVNKENTRSQAKRDGLGQTKDIVIFNMKRKRYSVVSLYG